MSCFLETYRPSSLVMAKRILENKSATNIKIKCHSTVSAYEQKVTKYIIDLIALILVVTGIVLEGVGISGSSGYFLFLSGAGVLIFIINCISNVANLKKHNTFVNNVGSKIVSDHVTTRISQAILNSSIKLIGINEIDKNLPFCSNYIILRSTQNDTLVEFFRTRNLYQKAYAGYQKKNLARQSED